VIGITNRLNPIYTSQLHRYKSVGDLVNYGWLENFVKNHRNAFKLCDKISQRSGSTMLDHWAKTSADHTWTDQFEAPYSRRRQLLIIGACALVSWDFVILVGVGVLRLLVGY
jgi:hypothetical protein